MIDNELLWEEFVSKTYDYCCKNNHAATFSISHKLAFFDVMNDLRKTKRQEDFAREHHYKENS